MEGRKDDHEKLKMDLIPPEAIEALAAILSDGAKRYGERNWEKGMNWGRVYAAALRHLFSWWKGENKDPESGFSHLWHALCCVSFLVTYEKREIGKDDRPSKLEET